MKNYNLVDNKGVINNKYLLTLFFISFITFFIFKNNILFTPITYYITSVHEVCHAIATLLTGGEVVELNLHSQGGFVSSSGGFFPIISLSGYLGTALIGATMLYCSKSEKLIDLFFIFFSLSIIIINFIYINSYFNIWFWSSVIVSSLILLSIKLHYTRFIGITLSSIFAVDSFNDIRNYLLFKIAGLNYSKTDAEILAEYFNLGFLSFLFAIGFAFLTIVIYYKMFKIILNNEKK